MSIRDLRYTETFPEEFSIKHKISSMTEKKTFHLHRQLEIMFALSGNLKCRFENDTVEIPRYGMILLDQMNLHYIFCEEGSGACDRYVLYFSSNYISNLSTPEVNLLECFLLSQKRRQYVLKVPDEQQNGFLSLLERMNEFQNNSDPTASQSFGWNLHTKFLLGQFLLLTNQLYIEQYGAAESPVRSMHTDLVYRIYDFIENYYRQDLNTDEIARQFGISKTQLYYIFKEVSGTTVSEYLADYRIAQAKHLLINTTHPVEMISQETGYGNLSSFSRVFKAKAGLSPLQYRKKYRS